MEATKQTKKYCLILPKGGYTPKFSEQETQILIWKVQSEFEKNLCEALDLTKVQAPLFVTEKSGLNDELNGVERCVSFDCFSIDDTKLEIVQSLAKWKRMALKKYKLSGLVTNMFAIRRDEMLSNIHSLRVDQWDWEKVIKREERTMPFLQEIVKKIYAVFVKTSKSIAKFHDGLKDFQMKENITFISSLELEKMYPKLTPQQREHKFVKEKKVVFLSKIGGKLKDGQIQDGRAPDYDDWELNGDILVWCGALKLPFELSSMGIRVDSKSLDFQLKERNCEYKKKYEYHKMILEDKLPFTIGGGIGMSRVCQYFLSKIHIGEVQSSIWPKEMREECEKFNIFLL